MNQLISRTLAQIVTGDHRTASIFEKYNLDFCCKGKRSLQQACAEQNISVDNLLRELEIISSAPDLTSQHILSFDKLSASQLVDYIVSIHHSYVKKQAPQLFAYLEKVTIKHGDRHPELRRIFELFANIKDEMDQHMQKEELILFPRIKKLEQTSAGGNLGSQLTISYLETPINIMEEEHDDAGRMMEEIKQLTNNYVPPQDACTTYRLSFAALQAFEADLHQHVHLENNILFPKALKFFQTPNQCSLH